MIDHDKPPIDVTALNTSWGWAAGGIISTTEDLTHFLKAADVGDARGADHAAAGVDDGSGTGVRSLSTTNRVPARTSNPSWGPLVQRNEPARLDR